MRFSAVASLLVAGAAAQRWNHGRPQGGWWGRPTTTLTVEAPETTLVAPPASTEAPVNTVIVPQPTTLVTKTTQASAPVETGDSSASDLTSDQQAALDAHNAARSEVGTSALVWDASLAADAQTWADQLASTGTFQHSGVDGQGENLYMQSNSDSPFLNAANAFISEKSLYNGEVISGSNYQSFGHYTQVVWKDTTKVGMAVARGSSGSYVVCRYQAPGNYIGQKPY